MADRTLRRLTSFIIIAVGLVHDCCSMSPLFDYGKTHGPKTVTNSRLTEVDLGHEVPFFGRKYSSAYISADGLLGFNENVGYQDVQYKDGVAQSSRDVPFIAIFHYKGKKVSSSGSNIFYKLINDPIMLREFKDYVLNSTVDGSVDTDPLLALEVTWENVTEEMCVRNNCNTTTFQIMFVAFKKHSFVFVNYDLMDIPQRKYYQAGFNGGDGLGWKSILPCGQSSCKLTLNDLPSLHGSDVKGRFIFDVGGQKIRRGGCIPPEADGVLEFSPRLASLLGGQMLTVSGTCNPNLQYVKCRFGTDPHAVITNGIVVNSMLARCPVPRLTQRGDTEISFSVGGQDFRHKATIAIVQMGRFPCTLHLTGDWKQKDATRLSIRWNTNQISPSKTKHLEIMLIGYREIGSRVEWKKIKILKRNHPNTGSFSFSPNDYRCQDDECNFEIGVVEVRLRQTDWEQANTDIAVNCGMVPLGWFMRQDLQSWPDDKCKKWQTEDQKDMSWLEDLLPCPDTLNDALSDFGRWQPDDACYLNSKSRSNCNLHRPAIHCSRSFRPTKKGAGNQCCYGPNYKLIKNKSTPDRSHDWGSKPYNKPLRVPSASHWLVDIIPIFYCCKWSSSKDCQPYLRLRPAIVEPKYQHPKFGEVHDGNHIKTFDGFDYDFRAEGDFWLYRASKLKLQGRLDRQQNALTSVAMTEKEDVVEVRLSPSNLISGNRLQVLVNKVTKWFDVEPLRMQDFSDVSIITNEAKEDINRHGNFTVIFSSGVGVMIVEQNQRLNMKISLPPKFKKETHAGGLLGTWNDNKDDDLTIKGEKTSTDDFQGFGLSWAVKNNDRLFRQASNLEPKIFNHSVRASQSNSVLLMLCAMLTVCLTYYSTEDEAGRKCFQ